MSDYLNSVNSISAASSVQSFSSNSSTQPLSEETKKKLEALGVDTSQIKTENEGQKKLKEIQSVQQNQQVQQNSQATQANQGQQSQQNGSMATLIKNVKDLASDVGIYVGIDSDIETIFTNIQEKITEIKTSKVNSVEEDTKAMAATYQTRYESLYREYQSKKSSQSMLTNSLNALAGYNMAMI